MRVFSPVFLNAIHAQESGEVLLPLMRLSHTDWATDLRFVPDWQEITHGGEVYSPYAFEVSLPDDEDQGIPVLRWTADNVSQELIVQLRQVRGPISAYVVWVLASQPDTIEVGPLDLEIQAAEYDAQTISGTMGIEPILEEQFGYLEMTPSTAPGLF
ncbi:DUF1833 domain-containing protein [Roseovarius sp. PS-C2]|uniref:DUF1833 family protein n=1 Tax=Roseovarius sp. PS-C2 TaxID=2820814 RepID=UPI001C0D2AD5|nr:DUF1833 family protein [Roseovarius sp. PS-C2]MBU3262058.1 DUF1833 domain-containing protein [Roseovarius sp. PS-C2]